MFFFQTILHVSAPYIKKWGIFVTLGYTIAISCWIIMIWPLYKYTCEITVEKNNWAAIAVMILIYIMMWSELLEINIGLLAQQTTSSIAQLGKGCFWNATLDWYFVQAMQPQVLRLAVAPFIMGNTS